MKLRFLLTIGLVLLLISCDKTSVYSKLDKDFENNRWQSDKAKTFDFTIEDDAKSYNLLLQFSHVYDYEYNSVPLTVHMTSPDGKTETIPFELKIKDTSGKQLADCTGDMCDLVVPIKENVQLSKGTYKLSVSQSFKKPYLPNVLALGINVKTVQ